MPDFQTQPALTDTYTNILTYLRDKEVALAKMDYTTWTNLPTGAIRSNSASSYKLERWNGSAWVALDFHTTIDNHIANSTIHQAINIGSIQIIAYGTADSGWLLCDGSAVSRTTYASLFAKIGTAYGAGNGTTTFNVPNLNDRLPIGLGSVATPLGLAFGSMNHTHTTPTHQHTVSAHNHGNYHLHGHGGHSHTVPDHSHFVASHYHDTQASGADIRIISSGAHTHSEDDLRSTSTGSGTTTSYTWNNGGGTLSTQIVDSTNSDHVHSNADFLGRVGNVTSARNGDAGFQSNGSGAFSTLSSGGFYVDGPVFDSGGVAKNTTDNSTAFATPAGEGGGTTGSNNPPCLVVRFQIKT